MGDEHQRLVVLAQVRLQPLDGLEVEVVCGLVEEKHVRRAEQDLCQLGPGFLPAGELPQRLTELGFGKAEARRGPLLPAPPFAGRPPLPASSSNADSCHRRFERARIALHRGIGHTGLERSEALLDLVEVIKGAEGVLEKGELIPARRLLTQIPNADPLGARDVALVWLFACEDFEESTLARSVGTNEADAITAVDFEVNGTEDMVGSVVAVDAPESDQAHRGSPGAGISSSRVWMRSSSSWTRRCS